MGHKYTRQHCNMEAARTDVADNRRCFEDFNQSVDIAINAALALAKRGGGAAMKVWGGKKLNTKQFSVSPSRLLLAISGSSASLRRHD